MFPVFRSLLCLILKRNFRLRARVVTNAAKKLWTWRLFVVLANVTESGASSAVSVFAIVTENVFELLSRIPTGSARPVATSATAPSAVTAKAREQLGSWRSWHWRRATTLSWITYSRWSRSTEMTTLMMKKIEPIKSAASVTWLVQSIWLDSVEIGTYCSPFFLLTF